MTPFGTSFDNIVSFANMAGDADDRTRILRLYNKAYFDFCRRYSWFLLRQEPLTLDFDGVAAGGMWLPSNLFGIDAIRDEYDNEYVIRNRSDVEPDEGAYRAYTYAGSSTPLFRGDDVTIAAGESTFVSALLASDILDDTVDTVVDMYARFGKWPGYYKISSDTSPYPFTPEFHGEDASASGVVVVRPTETQKLVILDEYENELDDREVDVFYWTAPSVIWNDDDVPVLPVTLPIELSVLRELPEAKIKRPVSRDELAEAINQAVLMNPDFPRKNRPRDEHNKVFDITRLATNEENMFARR